MNLRLALALLAVLAASPAAGAGVESCEKIKDADAYNHCLASYGPAAGAHPTIGAPERADSVPRDRRKADPSASTTAAPKPGPQVTRKANGRMRMEILVPSGR